MKYVTAASIDVVCPIRPLDAAKSDPLKFHLEVTSPALQHHEMVNNPIVVAAVAGSPGTYGSVTFNAVGLPADGGYELKVYYASDVDLNAPGVVLQPMGKTYVQKVTPETTVTI